MVAVLHDPTKSVSIIGFYLFRPELVRDERNIMGCLEGFQNVQSKILPTAMNAETRMNN